MGLEEKAAPLEQAVGLGYFPSPLKDLRLDNRQADVFSCLYSETTQQDGTLGGILMERKMEMTSLFTPVFSGLVLKRLGSLIFEALSLSLHL